MAILLAVLPLGIAEGSRIAQNEQTTTKEVRAVKAPIYVEMAEASTESGHAQAVAFECQQASKTDCSVTPDGLEKARSHFENAQGQIFMFGSTEAMSAVTQMRKAGLNPNLQADGQAQIQEVDLNALRSANVNFQIAVCQEARADGCESR